MKEPLVQERTINHLLVSFIQPRGPNIGTIKNEKNSLLPEVPAFHLDEISWKIRHFRWTGVRKNLTF